MSVRVGYFPHNNSLWVLRHRGILERAIPDVEWVDLRTLPAGDRPAPTDGLPSLHGDHLFDGGYDFIGTGSTPPVTAQGKGHDVVYVAVSGSRHENGRLVVLEDSPIASLEDLKGKRVALGHGSWQTTLLLFALDKVGLGWKDIVPVDAGTDAGALLLNGEVDAWVGSYPSLSKVEEQTSVRELVATDGLFSHRSLWFTRRDFAEKQPEQLAAIVAALQESDAWIQENYREAAELFAADDGGDVDHWENALRKRPFGLHPVTEEFVAEQQRAADLFHAGGLIDRKIMVADAVDPEIAKLIG
ncbi:aliphatic sulfonate ABC transporter substrate-binding protein [Streptosporangium roseum]|uniref:Sulfonate ABC transporter, periplasmic sulfonate-binding protein SsuA n=1 Tax=Streptosporangium roseum (strain ATCC 12428 / DSM 43021 / JCM 3005 / KCTC 9067 / NCIMB 10171 / NRRL 2505 / NI 9100) TaxID=479432 RepID=D2ASY7_STRRD|nr:aliphatic sulfonate ABC transporter substrate-binding protein [Streptosporangium roseum]ACZ90464.1 sulfonate ABC transporter, periplasmic sulfonate- binding protein SsuA [Streptosporangium roseum DSM 43021]